jgi:hypothetical protein
MNKRTACWKFFYPLILLVLAAALAGCMTDPNEKFIQGVWSWNDPHFQGLVGESHSIINYLFENKTFQFSTCCFVETHMEGKYHINESEGDMIRLELYDLVGDMQGDALSQKDSMIVTIEIDREHDEMLISRSGPFTRLTPSNATETP